MRLLVIDDDPAIGQLIRTIAAAVGIEAEIAEDGERFKTLFDAVMPDLILLDLQIGDTDGVEHLKFLSTRGYRNPIVLMSGFDDRVLATTEQLARVLGLKPIAALSKPFRAERLKSIFEEIAQELQPLSPESVLAAIRGGELFLEYQPIVTHERRAVRWFEALARWNHPRQGRLPPDRFIALAEQSTPVIDALTDWAVATAAGEYRRLRDLGLATPMAVNISEKNFHDLSFPNRIQDLLRRAEVPAGHFCLEVIESAASQEPARTMEIVSRLRLKGIHVAIDDFGTGYSSLKQLRQLPFSALKIDRSFVADILTSNDALAIVKSTIDLARNMGLECIAEGVETEEIAERLGSLGVSLLQGYLISRPLPAAKLADWFKSVGVEPARPADDPSDRPALVDQPSRRAYARSSL